MLTYLYEALDSFRGVFSRRRSWLIFVMMVVGFIGASEMVGVTSFCRFWLLETEGYSALLHFFRSEAWSLETLLSHGFGFVVSQQQALVSPGRFVLLGDHPPVPKDGRRMPGVVTLPQDSETQSQPSYFRGHCWGARG